MSFDPSAQAPVDGKYGFINPPHDAILYIGYAAYTMRSSTVWVYVTGRLISLHCTSFCEINTKPLPSADSRKVLSELALLLGKEGLAEVLS